MATHLVCPFDGTPAVRVYAQTPAASHKRGQNARQTSVRLLAVFCGERVVLPDGSVTLKTTKAHPHGVVPVTAAWMRSAMAGKPKKLDAP